MDIKKKKVIRVEQIQRVAKSDSESNTIEILKVQHKKNDLILP